MRITGWWLFRVERTRHIAERTTDSREHQNPHPITVCSTCLWKDKHLILTGTPGHPITKPIILSEHLRLMHASHILLLSVMNQIFHIVGAHRTVRSITKEYITYKRHSAKLQDQLLGQLPPERVSLAVPFEKSGVPSFEPHLSINNQTWFTALMQTITAIYWDSYAYLSLHFPDKILVWSYN